jgi:hypothetical protein
MGLYHIRSNIGVVVEFGLRILTRYNVRLIEREANDQHPKDQYRTDYFTHSTLVMLEVTQTARMWHQIEV